MGSRSFPVVDFCAHRDLCYPFCDSVILRGSPDQKKLEMFAKIAEKKDDHEKFCKQFNKCLKLGIYEDCNIRSKIAELLRVKTSKSGDVQPRLNEYVDRLKGKLNDLDRTKIAELLDLVKKCLEMFAGLVGKKDDPEKFYEQFGKCLDL